MAAKTVDAYIAGLNPEQAEVVATIRQIIRKTAPKAAESVKWAQPVYEDNGPFCYIKAFKSHVTFGFWRGIDLPDPLGLLEGGGDRMRHVKLTSVKDIRKKALQDFIKEAVRLNQTKGDPTKRGMK